jgi:hypothetical protein
MLVRDFVEVSVPLETAVGAVSDPSFWERVLGPEPEPDEQVILARFGIQGLFGRPSRPLEVRVGEPTRQPRGTIVDLQWQAAGQDAWLPVMQADITLSALSSQLVHLEFTGCYCRSAALSAAPADRVVQQRVVEFAVRLILMRAVRGLSRSTSEALG